MKQVAISEVEQGQSDSPLIRLVKKIIADGVQAWNVSPIMMVVILLAPFAVAFAGIVAAALGKEAYKWLVQEDGFAESLQVIFYILTLILSLAFARRRWQSGDRTVALLYLGLSFGLFFLAGEELNWGQRFFGWQTSESFTEINKQGETNLHNIYGVGATFKWVQLLVGAYGALLPLLYLRWQRPERFKDILPFLVPHYTLVPYFAMLFIWRIYRNLWQEPQNFYFVISEYNEVMELALAMGLFLFLVYQFRRLKPAAL